MYSVSPSAFTINATSVDRKPLSFALICCADPFGTVALPGVTESAVIGVPDADFGEAVAAIVVAKNGHELTEAGVIAALKGEIASFKIPKRVHFVDDLPRNAMGKVQKNVLRETFTEPCSASTRG